MQVGSYNMSYVNDETLGSSAGTGGQTNGLDSSSSRPKILFLGYGKCGKTSILKVVFNKMNPNETMFLPSTTKPYRQEVSSSSFIQFDLWDIPSPKQGGPGENEIRVALEHFGSADALIFVIDCQVDYSPQLNFFRRIITQAYPTNKDIRFEVFIHKVDGLSDDAKIDDQRDICRRIDEDVRDITAQHPQHPDDPLRMSFYLTSIYDHSIYEALSKVVQKLIVELPSLENLLNLFISHSNIEKAFLFDVVSKIYIATDGSPVDMQSYELCCDQIDVLIDMSSIYGVNREDASSSRFDSMSASTIALSNHNVLYLRHINRCLALIAIVREDAFEKRGIIDYNFHHFKKSVEDIFQVRARVKQRSLERMTANTGAKTDSSGGEKNPAGNSSGSDSYEPVSAEEDQTDGPEVTPTEGSSQTPFLEGNNTPKESIEE